MSRNFLSRLVRAIICGSLSILATASCTRQKIPGQPIAFSHRLHVQKQITCTFCHSGAAKYSMATLPSVTLCMSCHAVIRKDAPEIRKVKGYLDRKEEIPWRRLYRLPGTADVFFNHRRHAAAGVTCLACHGDVGSKEALAPEVIHTMGFCVKCHRENKAKFSPPTLADDCATCHR